ncbi:unnamed protein product [Spirodela intermedia]|uniref:Uncharacterized protein n=1 Tax=Spirodela intermedia TaxID=51605 RepID=A0ABN7ECY2_SPIIN|nr:unnamed protein product [Spirodela intermedia]
MDNFDVIFGANFTTTTKTLCDYKALNKMTIKNKYSVPNAEDLFNKLE